MLRVPQTYEVDLGFELMPVRLDSKFLTTFTDWAFPWTFSHTLPLFSPVFHTINIIKSLLCQTLLDSEHTKIK